MLTADQLAALRGEPAEPNRLRKAMELAGFTQVQAAEAVGITQPYISAICGGNYKSVPVDLAQRLSGLIGCTVDDLFPLPIVLRPKEDRRTGDDRRAAERQGSHDAQ